MEFGFLAEGVRVQPYDKVFAVLEAVASSRKPVSLSEISKLTSLPLPTVHRLASQLESRGMLKRQITGKRYMIGHTMVRLSSMALNAAFSSDSVKGEIAGLARKLGEHCQIGINQSDEIIYVETARAPLSSGLHFEQGRRSPMHCSSIGKLYLAEMEVDVFASWLQRTHLVARTSHTIVSEAALAAEVQVTRQRGWARSDQELADGVVGCAVHIRDSSSRLIAGLGVSAPKARVSLDCLDSFVEPMRDAAHRIGELLDN